jgi:hypothetical protein
MSGPASWRLHLVLAGAGESLLWIAVGTVALLLLLLLSRYELHLVSRRAGLTLLGTRVAALLVLVAALFEPIAERRYEEKIRGRIVLGVDLSESMATLDPVAAAGLDSRQSPAEPSPAIARREIARRLVEGEWFEKIAADHDVDCVGFAREATRAARSSLARSLHEASGSRDPSVLATDWSGVLAAALAEDQSAPTEAVVLLTDGRENAHADEGEADRLAARGIPIYSVMIGSTAGPKDVAIASIKAPESVLKGDVASVVVTVKADGIPGVEVELVLERRGAPPLKQIVRGTADGSRPVVTFRVPMERLGAEELAVKIGPVIGDARPDNDQRKVTVLVTDDKAKVLLVDAEARWEFRYLYHALARDPRVTVEAVIFHQPRSTVSAETYKSAFPLPPRAGETDPLGAYDAIFLGDVDPGLMAAETFARLERFVAGRGGTLIMSAGPRSYPAKVLGLDVVRKLLPVLDPKVIAFDVHEADPAHPSLAPGLAIVPVAGALGAWPMLNLGPTPEQTQAVWAGLPRLPWALAGRVKPGASTLATVTGSEAGPGADAVIAAGPYGLGKVLWIGTDATWRWRFRVGDTYHHRFWGQVVRWAAAGKLTGGNDWVRFGPDRAHLPEGEGPRLTARFADGVPGVSADLLAVARVFKGTGSPPDRPRAEGDAVAIVPLQGVPGQPRTFAAAAPALAAGRYVARLVVPQVTDALGSKAGSPPEATLEIVPRQTSEVVELTAARDPLDRLASTTGGQVFTADQAENLLGLLRDRTIVKTRTEETTLWDRPWALLLFFGIVTFEWVLRKRVGLP